jgi:amino acid adenylation domain-containing protein
MSTKRVIFDSRLIAERDYWLERLADTTTRASLRTDFERPAVYDAARRVLDVVVPDALTERLNRATKDSPFLLYTILLAALKVCLYKYTGERLIVVGSPARRQETDGDGSRNALAIVDRIDEQLSFRQFLPQVRESLTEAQARQSYPFARLLQDAGLEKVENRCPLFDVALVLENIHRELPDLRNDITLTFRRTPEGISGEVAYESGLFRAETVERFTGHFISLLERALENVDRPLRQLDMLAGHERRQILSDWNGAQADFPRGCIHRLFEARAFETPQATALVYQDEQLTYGELNERANRLAHYLQGRGVGPETVAGICLNSSPQMIVALLAVLKAGGAYLPLDPTLPPARIAYMLRDAGARVVITEQNLWPNLSGDGAEAVYLDSQSEEIGRQPDDNPQSGATLDNLAYVIYTSGSTGQPKGVMVEHRGVCNMVFAQVAAFGIRPETRLLQFASLGFDASVSEIFTSLLSGAALCLADRETMYSPVSLGHALQELEITTVTLPPALLSIMPAGSFPKLSTVVSAGENCTTAIVERWSEGRRLINAYGPTEATVCASLFQCSGRVETAPPIGRPIANVQIYLLDQSQQLVPAGVAGELYIGGEGLARGYVNRPELTAEKFIPHPFGDVPGARLYRTGDSGRYLPDGQIEFLGRTDSQVKIRGFRIELGEIEAVLRQHEGVREAVVVNRQEPEQESRLVAYVIPSGETLAAAQLRGFIRERLPDYMTPAHFVMLAEFPLNTSGKIDRQRLPAPEQHRPELQPNYVAPRTEAERQLVDIWKEVLGVEQLGIHDNFFELGGHSLMVAQVISRVAEVLQVELPVRALFESPTVAELSVAVSQQAGEVEGDNLSDILAELDQLSDEEAEELLTEQKEEDGKRDAASIAGS